MRDLHNMVCRPVSGRFTPFYELWYEFYHQKSPKQLTSKGPNHQQKLCLKFEILIQMSENLNCHQGRLFAPASKLVCVFVRT